MRHTLSLILPVLIPSWRFFHTVAPSPRVRWRLMARPEDAAAAVWQVYRPRPAHVSLARMLARLVWNPDWNDELFVLACAERIAEQPNPHAIAQISDRVAGDLPPGSTGFYQFCLVFVRRDGTRLVQEMVYVSQIMAVPA